MAKAAPPAADEIAAAVAALGGVSPPDPLLAGQRRRSWRSSSISSATSCCPSSPAWCWPISSIRSPTGCSGSACRALMATVVILIAFIVVLVLALRHPGSGAGHADGRFRRQAAGISDPAAGADHQLRSAMAGAEIRRRCRQPARRAEFAADLGLRLADDGLHLDLEFRRGAGFASSACSW